MIKAMVNAGIKETQIRQILNDSNHFLVTWEDVESERKK